MKMAANWNLQSKQFSLANISWEPVKMKAGQIITTAGLTLITVVTLSRLAHSSAAEISREAVHDDPFVAYPYRLTCTSPFGKIDDSALPGSQVPVDSSLPNFEFTESNRFLTLNLAPNALYVNEDNSSNRTSPSKREKHSTVSPANNLDADDKSAKNSKGDYPSGNVLPEGVRIDISDEKGNVAKVSEKSAFTLDEHLHIVVENPRRFQEVDGIEFWVVAILQEKDQRDRVVSNPLSFVVKIEHSQPEREGAPVYAGIVVLIVCLFALLIPLTVRTKRRLREGKPVCACGSSSKKLEQRKNEKREEETGAGNGDIEFTQKEETKVRNTLAVSSIEQSELGMILGGKQSSGLMPKPGETLQSNFMRSVSMEHFQPHWLDPHYSDVYERPKFLTPTSKKPPQIIVSDESETSTSHASVKQTKL